MRRLALSAVGPIKHADITFGDLTVLVGEQASGKTIFLEMLKLVVDAGYIHSQLSKHGVDWEKDPETFFDIYLGEGMHDVVNKTTAITVDSQKELAYAYVRRRKGSKNRAFYIPAQRVLTLSKGWPQPFQSYEIQDPYVVREFSERFRMLMDKEYSRGGSLFPQTNRLKKVHRDKLTEHIFHGFELCIDVHGARRRLVLRNTQNGTDIPFMTWSAGQREFVPLLLGLYWLLPASKVSRREAVEWAVLEELEAGLHPAAISALLLIVLELISRGYKVCVSTHSPHVLDVVWAMRSLKASGASADRVLDLFQARRTPATRNMATEILAKDFRVYYFEAEGGVAKEISNLDPGSLDEAEAGWGGLTEHSGRIADVVADVVAERSL